MYLRIELDNPADLDTSLKSLKSLLPKPLYNYYPYKKMVGAEWYGFSFIRFDPLLDWKSIGAWCDLSSATSEIDESCQVLISPGPEQVLEAAPLILDKLRKSREFSYAVGFYFKKYKTGIRLELSQVNKQLQVDFDFAKFPSADATAKELISQLWLQARKSLPSLKTVSLELGKRVQFIVNGDNTRGVEIQTKADRLTLNYLGPTSIRAAFIGALRLAEHFKPHFESMSTNFSLQLLPTDAAKVSQELSAVFKVPTPIFFDGHYRQDFHPDQVLRDFPTEGYWQLPLFCLRGGRESFDEIEFFLVQTPKERFVEVLLDKDHHLTKVKGFLDGSVKMITHDGPNEKRWNLHRLKKK